MPRLFEPFLSLVPWIALLLVFVIWGVYWLQKLRRQAKGDRDSSEEDKLLDLEALRREGSLTDGEYRALRDRLKHTGAAASGVQDRSATAVRGPARGGG